MDQKNADNVLFSIKLDELGPDINPEELTDEMLFDLSGGRSRGNCPPFTRRICGTFDGEYRCVCVPKSSSTQSE